MSSIAPPQSPLVERRPTRRRRTLLAGRVCFDAGSEIFDCTIRNLSASGARITVPKDQPLPKTLYLIKLRDRVAFEATVVWTKGTEAGLAFRRTLSLGELNDPKLAYLHRLWFEHSSY